RRQTRRGDVMDYVLTEGVDEQVFTVFVDMLGFSDLVETFPHTAIRRTEGSVTTTETTAAATTFERFHRTLENLAERDCRPSSMMIFSDSAFLVCSNVLLAATIATDLMRHLI